MDICSHFCKCYFTNTFSRLFLYLPFLENYGQYMDRRQEKETSDFFLFGRTAFPRNKMDDFHCTSLVIKGMEGITDSQLVVKFICNIRMKI